MTKLVKEIDFEVSIPIVPLNTSVIMADEGFFILTINNVKFATIVCAENKLFTVMIFPERVKFAACWGPSFIITFTDIV